MQPTRTNRIFQLDLPSPPSVSSRITALVAGAIEKTLALPSLDRCYETTLALDGPHFFDRILQALDIRYDVPPDAIERIPTTGPLVVVANHPFGAVEGIVLAALLLRVRPDVRVMVNYLLARIPQLHSHFIFVDPFGKPDSPRANVGPLKQSLEWIEQGGALVVFPAGEVSHIDLRRRTVTDAPWSETIGRIARKTGAPVLPVFFDGANGPLFQLSGLIHPRLRTALLPREFLNKRNRTLRPRIGNVLSARHLATFESDREVARYLRMRTYVLGCRTDAAPAPRPPVPFFSLKPKPARPADIIPPQPSRLIRDELERLPADRTLVESGDLAVVMAEAPSIPGTLREIGRLREITFRQTGEGTGMSCDLDEFDSTYTQLILWDRTKAEIVGGYRFGRTDEILKRSGVRGLYTWTLFDYAPDLLEQIGPALELGRSFVRSEYQKSYAPLMLLWKGIGAVVKRNPRYHNLFGPVSISRDYETISRRLMVAFLTANDFAPELARRVRARVPFDAALPKHLDPAETMPLLKDLDAVSTVIEDLERDRKGIPVLLRQYLKLGGKLLGFNRDPLFNDSLDGLMWVDLRKTERRLLERYMGKEGIGGHESPPPIEPRTAATVLAEAGR